MTLSTSLCAPRFAAANTYTWTSASGTDFNLPGNWSSSTVPGSADTAQFATNPTSTTTGVGFDFSNTGGGAAQSLGAISVSSTRGADALIIGNGSSVNGTLTLDGATIGTQANTILSNASATTLTLQNYQGTNSGQTMGLVLGNTSNFISVANGGTIVISDAISEANALSSITFGGTTGSPDLVLNASNAYTGGTTVNLGYIIMGNSNALGTGTVTVNNYNGIKFASGLGTAYFGALAGTQQLILTDAGSAAVALNVGSNNANSAFSGVISGTGSITKVGSGILTLNGTAAYSGTTTINSGTLQLGTGGGLPAGTTITLANAANTDFDVNGQTTTVAAITGGGATGGNVSLGNGALTISSSSGTSAFLGAITGNGTFTKKGGSIVRLGGASTFSGGTTLNGGELDPETSSVLSGSTIASSPFGTGTLTLISGTVSNPYALGNGALTIANPLTLAGGAQFGNYQDGSNLTFSGAVTVNGANNLAVRGGSGTSIPQGQLVFSGNVTGTGSLTFLYGESPTIFSGTSTYSGATILGNSTTGGSIVAGSNTGLSPNSAYSLVQSNAQLQLDGFSNTIGSLAGTTGVVEDNNASPATLTLGNDNISTTYGGTIQDYPYAGATGKLSLVKIGTGTFGIGLATYTGSTTVDGGAVIIDASQRAIGSLTTVTNPLSASTALTVNGATFGLLGRSNGAATSGASWTGATNSAILTFSSGIPSGITVGQTVTGTGIASGDYIVSINAANNTVTLNGNATATSGNFATTATTFLTTQTLTAPAFSGAASLTVNGNSGGGAVLNIGAFTRATASTIDFTLPSGTQSSTNGITDKVANTAGTILGGWATANGGASWATSAGTSGTAGNITALSNFATNTWASGDDTDVTSSFNPASLATNSVRFNSSGNDVVTLASGTSTIASGGILVTNASSTNIPTLTGGALTSGNGTALYVQQFNTSNSLTIASNLVDSTGPIALIKSGGGALSLTNANTYSGGTTVLAGTLSINNAIGSATGSGSVFINAKSTLAGTGSFSGALTVASGGVVSPGTGGAVGTLTTTSTASLPAGSTLDITLNQGLDTASQFIGNGVTLGGTLQLISIDAAPVAPGTVFTILTDTSGTPLTTSFAGLTSGTTISDGTNEYVVSYSSDGGDAVTLTATTPEPATLGFFALGGLAILRRRRGRTRTV